MSGTRLKIIAGRAILVKDGKESKPTELQVMIEKIRLHRDVVENPEVLPPGFLKQYNELNHIKQLNG